MYSADLHRSMADTALVRFHTDLRVHDNGALARTVDADRVLPVYCFDPREFEQSEYGPAKTGPYRARFLRESVRDLRESLRDLGGDLAVRHGEPESVIPDLAAEHGADRVCFETKPATEEYAVEGALVDALGDRGIAAERTWGKTLYHIEDLPTDVDEIDDTFTPWREEVEREATVRDTHPMPDSIRTPDVEPGEIPTLADLGIEASDGDGASDRGKPSDAGDPDGIGEPDDRAVLDFRGGETAGLARLEEYVWERDRLREYKETRNGLLGADYSSKFSPWLALGCLSPRRVHQEVERYERERVANDSTYWLVFELLWRDFMTFQFERHGGAFFTPTGIRDVHKDWRRDEQGFGRWAAGETGVPFVDANVRELNATGYMSNRGRQNVASFLADVLGIDWRLGAAHFEAKLLDYDVCSNWGNWAYQAGVGNDSRDNYFDVLSQGERYDPDGQYVRHWLPELGGLPAEAAREPWRLTENQQAAYGVVLGEDYPEPMVDVERAYDRLRE
jgi:deoxyribodipyrimidine photo-lyase